MIVFECKYIEELCKIPDKNLLEGKGLYLKRLSTKYLLNTKSTKSTRSLAKDDLY